MNEDKLDVSIFYEQLSRIDILCGPGSMNMPVHSCEKCRKETCKGIGKCKGYGSYVLGISMKGIK